LLGDFDEQQVLPSVSIFSAQQSSTGANKLYETSPEIKHLCLKMVSPLSENKTVNSKTAEILYRKMLRIIYLVT